MFREYVIQIRYILYSNIQLLFVTSFQSVLSVLVLFLPSSRQVEVSGASSSSFIVDWEVHYIFHALDLCCGCFTCVCDRLSLHFCNREQGTYLFYLDRQWHQQHYIGPTYLFSHSDQIFWVLKIAVIIRRESSCGLLYADMYDTQFVVWLGFLNKIT